MKKRIVFVLGIGVVATVASSPPPPDGPPSVSFVIENRYAESIFSASWDVPDADEVEDFEGDATGVIAEEVRLDSFEEHRVDDAFLAPAGTDIIVTFAARSLGEDQGFDPLPMTVPDESFGAVVCTVRYDFYLANAAFGVEYGCNRPLEPHGMGRRLCLRRRRRVGRRGGRYRHDRRRRHGERRSGQRGRRIERDPHQVRQLVPIEQPEDRGLCERQRARRELLEAERHREDAPGREVGDPERAEEPGALRGSGAGAEQDLLPEEVVPVHDDRGLAPYFRAVIVTALLPPDSV